MNDYSFDYGYPTEEKKSDKSFTNDVENPYNSHDCRYSRTCYEANCFDCGMYNNL